MVNIQSGILISQGYIHLKKMKYGNKNIEHSVTVARISILKKISNVKSVTNGFPFFGILQVHILSIRLVPKTL